LRLVRLSPARSMTDQAAPAPMQCN
jgi:hypothetical protein